MTAAEGAALAAELRCLREQAGLETCPGRELAECLERPGGRAQRAELERHLSECSSCGLLIATAMRSAPADGLAPSAVCLAIARQALVRPPAPQPLRRWILGWGLGVALFGLVLAPSLRRVLLHASERALASAALIPGPLRLGPADRPGGDALRAGPAAPVSSPELERALVLLRAAEWVGAEPTAVGLLRARVELLRGAPRRAIAVLEPLVRDHPEEARAHAHLAAARLQLGQRAAAHAAAARAHQLRPSASWALYDLALLSEPSAGAVLFSLALERERDPDWRRQIERARAALAP
jgi:hypothetical protein